MIQPTEESGGEMIQIGLMQVPPKERKFKCNSNYIRLQYEKPERAGELFLPNQAKGLEWITAVALDVGPECKVVRAGDRCLLAASGMVNKKDGVLVEGQKEFFTQENFVVAVVE